MFGMFADSQQPRDVERDEDGYVPNNLASCSRFKAGLRIQYFFYEKYQFLNYFRSITNLNRTYQNEKYFRFKS